MTTYSTKENRFYLNFKINTFLFKSPNRFNLKVDPKENVDDQRISYVSFHTLIKFSKYNFLILLN